MNTLSPKRHFLAQLTKDGMTIADSFGEMVLSPTFHTGAQAALLEYAMSLKSANPHDAATNGYRLEGAKEFLDRLMNIYEKHEMPALAQDEQLEET